MSSLRDIEPSGVNSEGPPLGPRITRRRLLTSIGGLGLAGGGLYLVVRGITFRPGKPSFPAPSPTPIPNNLLDALAANIVHGGPGKDGIPAIDEPRFVPASEADFLGEYDVVFGLARLGEVRAYPQLVLVWHEIVNDRFPDGRLSVTYCPLTGSVIGFRGIASDGKPYTFGTSGDLVNTNLLMYDRQTDSRWPQILGQAILGPSRGVVLEEVPLEWTTWGRWRRVHPETMVLSTDTGYLRPYGNDPYGSYNYGPDHHLFGYYEPGQGHFVYFPVMHESSRFDEKEVFIGLRVGDGRVAVSKGLLRDRRVIEARLEGRRIVLLYYPAFDEGRALTLPKHISKPLLPADEAGTFVDRPTGSVWDAYGRAIAGPLVGEQLRPIPSFDVMWLGWYAFFPGATVIG